MHTATETPTHRNKRIIAAATVLIVAMMPRSGIASADAPTPMPTASETQEDEKPARRYGTLALGIGFPRFAELTLRGWVLPTLSVEGSAFLAPLANIGVLAGGGGGASYYLGQNGVGHHLALGIDVAAVNLTEATNTGTTDQTVASVGAKIGYAYLGDRFEFQVFGGADAWIGELVLPKAGINFGFRF